MKAMSEMLSLPPGFGSWANLGLALGAVGVVTGARLALLGSWPEFKAATNRSNRQVLQPLNWFDIALVAALSGLSEEFLFRCGQRRARVLTRCAHAWRCGQRCTTAPA
jgi:membrane protease YdiL (CAAX protease family)